MRIPFKLWFPILADWMQLLVLELFRLGYKPGYVSAMLSAVGTFAAWINHPWPRCPAIEYLLKGEQVVDAVPPKAQVHVFPFDLALANLDAVLESGLVTGWLGRA